MSSMKELEISEYQKRFFLEWVIDPSSTKYNVSFVYKIKGELDKEILKKACEKFTQDNEIVHARFSADGEKCFYSNYKIDDFYDEYLLENFSDRDVHEKIRQLLDKKFDLTKDVLQRFYLLETNKNLHYFVLLANHHIITDATYAVQEVNQVSHNYNSLLSKTNSSIQVSSFSKAVKIEKNLLTEEFNKKAKIFWKNFIRDTPLNVTLPYKRNINNTNNISEYVYIDLDKSKTNKLKKLARSYKVTPFILISAIYGIVVSKFSNQNEFLLTYPVDMRPNNFKDVVGCFVNNVPLRINIKDLSLLSELLRNIRDQRKATKEYQGYSMTHIVNDQRVIRGDLPENYLNVSVAQTNLNTLNLKLGELEVESLNISWSDESIDELGLLYDEYLSNQLRFKLYCNKNLFFDNFIYQFKEGFTNLLNNVLEREDLDIKRYSLLFGSEYQTIVYDWNHTDVDYPSDKTIYELFEDQVEKNSNHVALVNEDDQLTYKELNERANQLARHIRKRYKAITGQELVSDTLIALCLERSLDMVTGILAVMKSGGAYVPMDPGYPDERFKHILSDTDSKLVVTQSHLEQKLRDVIDIELVSIDEQDDKTLYSKEETINLPKYSQSNDLAYVIYTSGTTGVPKGVLQTHNNVHRLLSATDNQFMFSPKDVWTLYHSYIFDFTAWELWGSLAYGCKLIIPSKEVVKDISSFVELCSKYKVTVLNQTPFAFYTFIDQLDNKEDINLNSIRYVIFGGDALNVSLLNKWWDYKRIKNLQTKLINMYGITETTVHVTYKEIDENESVTSNIGQPIDDLKAYVLDKYNQPVPIGVIGELYIGGAGLARGYLNRPKLTAEKFVPNQFATESDKAKGYTRLYKTGDLVRWLPDGNIEYIGRNDFQVKIRGYRIELGEIENQLSSMEGIKQCRVLAKDINDINYLVGYYVADEALSLSNDDILSQLSKALPDYMVPSVLVEIDSMPLTVNGKLDRRALPAPEFANEDNYVVPTTELEITLCNIVAEVLNLDKVGVTEDFFRIGGNSILAIKLSHRLSQVLGKQISVADIFRSKNVLSLEKDFYKLDIIKPFYNVYNTEFPDLLLIHPGHGGCEVYHELANKLVDNYNCIGIDNYNIYSDIKISSLNKLSMLYVSKYLTQPKSSENNIYLLGWSIGGQIALEMASILELKNFKNIKVILLDTVIKDSSIEKILSQSNCSMLKEQLKNVMLDKYSSNYVNKVIDSFDTEVKLFKDKISNRLNKSNVILLKAIKQDNLLNNKAYINLNKYILTLSDNNISDITSNLTVLEISSNHGEIIERLDDIIKVL